MQQIISVGITTNGDLQSIGDYAFTYCGRLSRIDLPEKIAYVNGSAFYGATSMKTITVPDSNSYFTVSDGALYTKNKTTVLYLPAAQTGRFTIASETLKVGDFAFRNSEKAEIVIPNGVTELGRESFAYSKIRSIFIPNSVGAVSDEYFTPGAQFYNCYYLKSAVFEDNSKLSKLGSDIFKWCSSLASVSFGENSALTEIDDGAFDGCYSLKEITVPKGVATIGSEAFYNSGLQTVIFESDTTLTKIFNDAFRYCRSLTEINLPSSVTYIGDSAFLSSGLTKFTVGKNIAHLGDGALAYCADLTSLTVDDGNAVYTATDNVIYYNNENDKKVLYVRAGGIDSDFTVPDDVYIIGMYAFAGSGVGCVTLNEGLNEIKNNAFSNCGNLKEIIFPDSLETIGVEAFSYCTSLGDIVITKNIITLARFAFRGDYNIKNITIEEGSKLRRLGYGVFGYTGITSFTVPSFISSIAQYAFVGCSALKTVTFAEGNSLTSISAYMFDGVTALETINFANDNAITHIQARAFSEMYNLKYINWEVLTNLQEIDNYAFWNCRSLQNVTLPQGVTYIGRYAFTDRKSVV